MKSFDVDVDPRTHRGGESSDGRRPDTSTESVDPKQVDVTEITEQLLLKMIEAQSTLESQARTLREVTQHAQIDPLTKLPNRLLLFDRCARAIAQADRHRGRLAVLFLDIDKFKEINDRGGHIAGDRALRSAAGRLLSAVRAVDTVSRFGGDEFVILISEVSVPADAVVIAMKILAALAVGDAEAPGLIVSIGLSIYPEDGVDPETLIARADLAMYDAKAAGGRTWARFGAGSPRASTRSGLPEHRGPPQRLDPATQGSASPTWMGDVIAPVVRNRRDSSRDGNGHARSVGLHGSAIPRRIADGAYTVRFKVCGDRGAGGPIGEGRALTGDAVGYRFSGDLHVCDGRATASVTVQIDDRAAEHGMDERNFTMRMTGAVVGAGFSLRGVGPRGVVIEIDGSDDHDPSGSG